ncbi:uncharacterized protein LAJ45_08407 [Morchella importuna]|uniref:uncharacterized protein n=1 Tax=Morchella importuna TaxID=1174673 RepID=UPI001E8D191E|nr:uncharacterized protein LAJ45_08407 [Morchella importuna]KAH8147580.1 hypothetical protein LAJ45_08407 [Morchella importuna]
MLTKCSSSIHLLTGTRYLPFTYILITTTTTTTTTTFVNSCWSIAALIASIRLPAVVSAVNLKAESL